MNPFNSASKVPDPGTHAATMHVETSLLRRWVTTAGIVLIALIVAADVYEAWQDYRTTLSQNEQSQLALSRALAEQTARMVQEVDVVLSDYAEWAVSPEGRTASEAAMRERLRADVKRLPFVYSASIAGADGHLLATTQDNPVANRTLEKRAVFAVPERAQDNALYIGQPFIGSRDGLVTFSLSRRINDQQGAFAGVVVARVAFEYLTGFYAGVDVTPDTSIRLAREDGVVLAQYPQSDEAISDNLYTQQTYTALAQSKEQVHHESQAGRNIIVALHRVEGYPIVVDVSRSVASVLRPWLQRELGSATRTLILVVLAGLLLAALRVALQRRDRLEYERRRLEHELENAQRAEALGTLAASVAHDFNNVLTAIVGYAELARKTLAAESTALLNVDRLLDATERARLLVRRVLTFNPHRSLSYQPLSITPVIIEVLQQVQATLPQSITVRTSGLELPQTILGDATEMYQVVMNLCSNAVHAMPSGGTLELRLDAVEVQNSRLLAMGELHAGRWLCLSIIDSGVGLAEEQLKSIFEPFYTTRQPGQGTGIGLTVVRNIILRMHGALDVDSRLGWGTRMSVYWPLIGPEEVAAAATPKLGRQSHGETILVVDDDTELVMLAEEVLASLGYEPVGFADARAALAAFQRDPGRFDAVLTDERMQPMRGCELARFIHELAPNMPVILMTGHRDDEVDRQAQAANIAAILDKPLRVQTLRTALAQQLALAAELH